MPRRVPAHRRLTLLALVATLIGILAFATSASADVFTPESGGSPNADAIDTLYKIVLYVAIPIFLLVEGTLIWALVKFRARRGGPEPAQIRGNTPLEMGWTAGAALILLVLAVTTFVYLGRIKDPPASGPDGLASGVQVASINQPSPPPTGGKTLTIGVNGQQYLWRFTYPASQQVFSYHDLVVPTDTTVILKITSSDVAHSWWIPKLGGKADAVPGHTNETWFKISEAGNYDGQCAELCGSNHADMRSRVIAMSPDRYTAWINRQAQNIKDAQQGLSIQRSLGEGAEN